MALISNTTSRRFRFFHVQIVLACVAFLGYFVVTSIYRRASTQRSLWEIRREELRKYGSREVDLKYVRKIGRTYGQIEDLTENQIDNMNGTELLVTINSFLDNPDTTCRRKIRMGVVGDGGWDVCDDEQVRLRISSCLVYSFQVHPQFDFQEDLSRVFHCEVHSFNPYFAGQDYNRSQSVFVHPYGIGRNSYVGQDGQEFYSLPDIKAILGHLNREVDIIQLSLEGGEWPVLYSPVTLNEVKHVKQLYVEFHIGYPPIAERHRRMIRVLRGLRELGFRKYYVHKRAKGAYHHPDFPVMQAKHYEVHYVNSILYNM